MKKFYNFFASTIFIFACLILPKAARAATLSFSVDSRQISVGDVFVAKLDLDSAGEKINVAQAAVHFDSKALEVKNIGTGGSIFNQWASGPSYDNQAGNISFTGGTTESFSGSLGNILKIAFYAKQKGQTALSFAADSAIYLADGKGTKISPLLNGSQITISDVAQNQPSTNQWDKILADDKTPPKI